MAFTGTHFRTLDDKSRLAIPKIYREGICAEGPSVTTMVIAPETEQALALYSESQFQRRAEEVRRCTRDSQELRTFLRLYFSQAESVEIDKQGRIRIPERLIRFAGLQQEVVLLGVNDRVEIWDRGRWETFMQTHSHSFDQFAYSTSTNP
jgi:MraZ protein